MLERVSWTFVMFNRGALAILSRFSGSKNLVRISFLLINLFAKCNIWWHCMHFFHAFNSLSLSLLESVYQTECYQLPRKRALISLNIYEFVHRCMRHRKKMCRLSSSGLYCYLWISVFFEYILWTWVRPLLFVGLKACHVLLSDSLEKQSPKVTLVLGFSVKYLLSILAIFEYIPSILCNANQIANCKQINHLSRALSRQFSS